MKIRSRRTVEGFISATADRITDIDQLKVGDIVMMGYVQWPEFLPYRVIDVDGELYLTNVSAVKKHRSRRLAVQLSEDSLDTILLYRTTIDTSDKTHPGYMYLAVIVTILALVFIQILPEDLSLIPLLIAVITTCFCIKAAKLPT